MNKEIHIKFNSDKNKKLYTFIAVLSVLLFIAAYLFMSSVYTVSDKERAIVTTFGKVTGEKGAGMHLKLPFGLQKSYVIEVNQIKKIEIGYRTLDDGAYVSVEEECKMITGDMNIINVDFFVEYRITNIEKYLFSSSEPEEIFNVLVQSQIRNVIASYSIDAVLTGEKEKIQSEIKDLIFTELEEYDIGLSIVDIRIQDSEPPTDEVYEAFMGVINADSNAKTAINNANAYKNTKQAENEAEVNKILLNAEYLKEKRINEALEEVAKFNAMFDEYLKFPEITKVRLYYEMIEKIGPDVKIYIDATDGGITKLLPIESIGG